MYMLCMRALARVCVCVLVAQISSLADESEKEPGVLTPTGSTSTDRVTLIFLHHGRLNVVAVEVRPFRRRQHGFQRRSSSTSGRRATERAGRATFFAGTNRVSSMCAGQESKREVRDRRSVGRD